MTEARIPAETFPPSTFIREELEARGWSERDFEVALFDSGCTPAQVLACQFALHVDDKKLVLDADTSASLGRCFGTSPDFFLRLHSAWRGVTNDN